MSTSPEYLFEGEEPEWEEVVESECPDCDRLTKSCCPDALGWDFWCEYCQLGWCEEM